MYIWKVQFDNLNLNSSLAHWHVRRIIILTDGMENEGGKNNWDYLGRLSSLSCEQATSATHNKKKKRNMARYEKTAFKLGSTKLGTLRRIDLPPHPALANTPRETYWLVISCLPLKWNNPERRLIQKQKWTLLPVDGSKKTTCLHLELSASSTPTWCPQSCSWTRPQQLELR